MHYIRGNFLWNMPPKKKLWLPEDQPTIKSMGFGSLSLPVPVRLTLNLIHLMSVMMQIRRNLLPSLLPQFRIANFRKGGYHFTHGLSMDAENNLMKCSVCLNAKKQTHLQLGIQISEITYWKYNICGEVKCKCHPTFPFIYFCNSL